MILACHQPHYLPWLGYYHKMAACDVFVYLDDVQFEKREYQNRNRVKSAQGELWLAVPVLTKGRRDQRIREVEVDATKDWGPEHLKALTLSYHKAPRFAEHEEFLEGLYARRWTHLAPLCLEWDRYMRERLGIATALRLESKLGPGGTKTERILSLCRKLGAETYLSGQGAKAYLDESALERAGVRLLYQDFRHPTYPQRFGPFLPDLAAVDMLFNVGAEKTRELLDIRRAG